MSAQSPTLRDALNTSAQPGRLADVQRDLGMGDLVALLVNTITPQETGVVPSANIATLANIPSHLFKVNATAAGVTGVKKLKIGKIGVVIPATGECVWEPGTKKVAFAAADAVTAAAFVYATGTEASSVLDRQVGQSDSP